MNSLYFETCHALLKPTFGAFFDGVFVQINLTQT